MVLTDESFDNKKMRDYLYRDRNALAVYAKAMFGMALVKVEDSQKLAMIITNIEQFLVVDDENQTAYLNLPNSNYWWYWYGSEYEAHAYYLKLLARTEPTEKSLRTGQVSAQQPQACHLLEQHPGYGRHRRSLCRLSGHQRRSGSGFNPGNLFQRHQDKDRSDHGRKSVYF
jgi:hypothetical protein